MVWLDVPLSIKSFIKRAQKDIAPCVKELDIKYEPEERLPHITCLYFNNQHFRMYQLNRFDLDLKSRLSKISLSTTILNNAWNLDKSKVEIWENNSLKSSDGKISYYILVVRMNPSKELEGLVANIRSNMEASPIYIPSHQRPTRLHVTIARFFCDEKNMLCNLTRLKRDLNELLQYFLIHNSNDNSINSFSLSTSDQDVTFFLQK